jgi:hypothetical protein
MRTEQQMTAIITRATRDLHLELARKWGFPAHVIAGSTFGLAVTMMIESGYTEAQLVEILQQLTAEYLAAIVEPGWRSPERRTKTAAHDGPAFVEGHVQRTVFVGDVDDRHESDVFGLPKFCKAASLCRVQGAGHLAAVGRIRFFQNPDGTNCVGDFVLSPESCVEVPDKGQYFSVFNHSGHTMKMAVIFELAL